MSRAGRLKPLGYIWSSRATCRAPGVHLELQRSIWSSQAVFGDPGVHWKLPGSIWSSRAAVGAHGVHLVLPGYIYSSFGGPGLHLELPGTFKGPGLYLELPGSIRSSRDTRRTCWEPRLHVYHMKRMSSIHEAVGGEPAWRPWNNF